MQHKRYNSRHHATEDPYLANHSIEVLNQLLVRVVESLKVDRAVIVLEKEGNLSIEADVSYHETKGAQPKSVFQIISANNVETQIPVSVINKTLITGDETVINTPGVTPGFSTDPYFTSQKPEFIACSPIFTEQPTVSRVLYIENQAPATINQFETKSAFSLWADQASLTVDNASKFKALQSYVRDRVQELNTTRKKDQTRIQFLADMNQEVRSPLNTIMEFSRLLLKKDRKHCFSADVKRYLENIQDSGIKLAELLENVLEYARIEAGKKTATKEDIDLRTLIQSVVHAQRSFSEKRGVNVRVEFDQSLPYEIFSQRSSLTKLFIMLTKYCIERSPTEKEVMIKGSWSNDELSIALYDYGKPLFADIHNPIITTSLKPDLKSSRDDENLEIAFAKQLIENLQGTIQYHVLSHHVSRFLVTIPCPSRSLCPGRACELETTELQRPALTSNSHGGSDDCEEMADPPLITNEHLVKELDELKSIPIYKGGTLVNRLHQINRNYVELNRSCPTLIRNLKLAVYDGNANKFQKIIKNAIGGYPDLQSPPDNTGEPSVPHQISK